MRSPPLTGLPISATRPEVKLKKVNREQPRRKIVLLTYFSKENFAKNAVLECAGAAHFSTAKKKSKTSFRRPVYLVVMVQYGCCREFQSKLQWSIIDWSLAIEAPAKKFSISLRIPYAPLPKHLRLWGRRWLAKKIAESKWLDKQEEKMDEIVNSLSEAEARQLSKLLDKMRRSDN